MKGRSAILCAFVAGVGSVTIGAAQAQEISRTTDGTLTWSDATFTGASMLYAPSQAWGGGDTFSGQPYSISLFSNFQNLTFQQMGGMTVTPSGPPFTNPEPVTLANSGSLGSWGWTYTTAADTSGTLPLTLGSAGGLATLNFNDGGFDTPLRGVPSIQFFVDIHLPGDWSAAGTATGDHEFNSIAAGFSTPTFIYDPVTMMTNVSSSDLTYTGGAVALNFTLFGGPVSAVPEPSTWAMMLMGFAGLGFLGYRGMAKVRAAA